MTKPTFKLEKHVPIPPPTSRSPFKQMIAEMEIGDSIFPLTKRELATARVYASKLQMITTARAEGDAWRLWSVVKKPAKVGEKLPG